MAEPVLSKRLQALADMVTPGRCVVDVGCDHGFVSIYLVKQGISPKVLAMDVRTGPLSRAQEHIAEYGLEDYISTRLSDGLLEFHHGEAQSLICAGMGGRLMTRILTESREKARALEELILQPQSELPEFRRFLAEEGYELLDENILCEDGKYYFLMKVKYSGKAGAVRTVMGVQQQAECSRTQAIEKRVNPSCLYERYGEILLKRRHPVLKEYLEDSLQSMEQIAATLATNENERAQNRLAELNTEMNALRQALALWDTEAEDT